MCGNDIWSKRKTSIPDSPLEGSTSFTGQNHSLWDNSLVQCWRSRYECSKSSQQYTLRYKVATARSFCLGICSKHPAERCVSHLSGVTVLHTYRHQRRISFHFWGTCVSEVGDERDMALTFSNEVPPRCVQGIICTPGYIATIRLTGTVFEIEGRTVGLRVKCTVFVHGTYPSLNR